MNNLKYEAYLEHSNLTVSNPDATAELLCKLFGWKIRWSGPALDDGYTVHVGGQHTYLAVYTHQGAKKNNLNNHMTINHLNHLGVVVDNLDLIEKRVIAQGLKPFSHADRKPGGRCFYFLTNDKLEIEVVSYTPQEKSNAGPTIFAGLSHMK